MARKARKQTKGVDYNIATLQPDELNELKKVVVEYVQRKENIENEITTLKEDLKTLDEEFSEKLDMKTLNNVLRILKIESKVVHKDAFDTYIEALKDPSL